MYALRKFFAYAAVAWQRATVYRGERIVHVMSEAVPLFVMLSLWNFLFLTGKMTQHEANLLAVYFILASLFNRLTASYFEDWMAESIKDGEISIMLVRPMSTQVFLMANELVWRLSGFLYSTPIYILLFLPIFQSVTLQFTLDGVLLSIALVVLSFFSRFYVSWVITITGFWMDKVKALTHFKWMMEGLFGGWWLPLTFFPPTMVAISRILPFYSWYFLPIQLMLGEMTVYEAIPDVGVAIGWTVGLLLLSQFMWNNALKQYTASGR